MTTKKVTQKRTGIKQLMLLPLLCYIPALLSAQAGATFTLENSSSFARTDEVVEVPVSTEVFGALSTLALYDESNAVVPYQALPGGEPKIIFQATVGASATAVYTLKSGTPAAAAAKTYGRQVAARYDDAAWENDLAAYRMYSKKLLTSEPNTANGVDLWLKKQAAPIVDKMYTYSDYHSEKPEGVDAYSVDGKTLGAGGVAAYANNKLWLHDPYDSYQLIANGPLRTEFLLTYSNVEVDGDFYTKTVRITANANGLLNKAVVKLTGKVKAMKLAAGIYKHSASKFGNANPVAFQSEPNLIGFAESKSEGTVTSPNARVFEGIYMPGVTTVSTVSDHLVIMSDYVVGTEFTCYFGGGWNIFPSGKYASDNAWFDALKQFKEATLQPLYKTLLPTKAEVVNAAVGVNNAWIAQNSSPGNNLWARSVYNAGNIDFYKVYRQKSYLDYANRWAAANSWAVSGGPGTPDADNHTCGQTYIDLYSMDETKVPEKIQAIKAAIDNRIANNPKSDDWWWIDAMFMAMPTLTRLGVVYNDTKYYDKMYALFSHIRDSLIVVPTRTNLWPAAYQAQYGAGPILRGYEAHCGLYSKADGLWWRDWGYQPNVPPKKEPGDASSDVPKLSPSDKNVYWSRGNGWALAAMARTLQLLPATDAHRQEYVNVLTSMAAALKTRQRDDGFWNMNLDDANDNPGPETSGTALFTYGIAWGINNGLLDRDEYLPVVAKAWKGLCDISVQPNGSLKYTQNVGEKPIPLSQLAGVSVDFGVGAFLLAASEVVKLAPGNMPEIPVTPLMLEAVTVQDSIHLQAIFDRDVDSVSAQTPSGYSVSNGATVTGATLTGTKTVTLTLGEALDYGRYTLFAGGVKSRENDFADSSGGKLFVYPVPLTPMASQVRITAIGNQAGNPPSNTTDNNLGTRWAQAGFNQWIMYDLRQSLSVWAVDVAFYMGDQRVAYFDVELSTDGVTFTKALEGCTSSGLTTALERYAFPPRQAQYVRIMCNSNSAGGENWNSITEVRIRHSEPAVTENVEELIMQRIQEAEWGKVENVDTLNAEAAALLSTLRADGSWADIPYTSTAQTDWPPINHLDRLKKLALAYTLSTSSYFESGDLHAKISAALNYWHTQDPRSTNWYMQQIGCPQRVGVILILMRAGHTPLPDELESKMTQRMKDIGGRPDQSGSQGTGANKIDIATHWVYRACLTKNEEDLDFGAQQVYYPIELTTATEGLQHDLSIMQHGPQFYTGGYGSSFAGNVVNMAVYLRETPYAISGEKLSILTRFVRESYMRIIRGKYFLYNVLGRGLARPGALEQSSLADLFGKTKFLDPDNAALYDSAVARLRGTQHGGYGLEKKHTHFFRADYTLYTAPDYTFDVRMASSRTYRNENGNGENLKGYFLAEGATAIAVDGDEYVDIFPVWEWTKIPGITAPQKATIPKPGEWGTPGTSLFAGGVSDGVYGASAYALNDQSYSINTAAKKAWFFLGKEVVCLGAGIQSSAAEPVNTTVNQCLLKGDVTVSFNGSESIAAPESSHAYSSAGWIHHNKVGYIFPQEGDLKMETKSQSGNWNAISTPYSSDNVTKSVFKLWFDHGVKPSGASYAYIVVPGVDLSAMRSYSASDVEILANTDSVQAVRHKTLGVVQAIFYRAASLAGGSFTLRTDKACAVMLKDIVSASVKVHVADPSQTVSTLKLRFTSPVLPSEKELECALPSPPYKGSPAGFTINALTPSYAASSEVTAIVPVADAFVRGGRPNYGADTILEVKEDTGDDYRRHAYLKFDLAGIHPDSVEKAELVLAIHSAGPRIAYTEWLFSRVEDDSWTEAGILWSNKPAADIPFDTVVGFSEGEVTVDVKDIVVNELRSKNGVLTLRISATKRDNGETWVMFHSREAADAAKRPQLRVEKKKDVSMVAVNLSISRGVTLTALSGIDRYEVARGGDFRLAFTVDEHYVNPQITVNGALRTPDIFMDSIYTLTTTVTGVTDIAVTATPVEYNLTLTIDSHITLLAPAAAGAIPVAYGSAFAVSFRVENGYQPLLEVDGAEVPLGTPNAEGVYTLTAIASIGGEHRVALSASKITEPPTTEPPTAVHGEANNDPVVEVKRYNLQGQEVRDVLLPGIYIVKKIHASKKVTVTKELRK
ncbi:MAG: glycoside hydrolase family 88 protein [Prevotellaceae bacterium]|nr:glycoside hydrolase family 88 protein [Prevotellaceae bacterium]